MPKGLPSQSQIYNAEAQFFSIDTNVLYENGFKFSDGPLKNLNIQIPKSLRLVLSEVVEREALHHRMMPALDALKGIRNGLSNLRRIPRFESFRINGLDETATVEADARQIFTAEMRGFVAGLNGIILSIDDYGTRAIFDRYFNQQAPFEERKKEEFPDAAALIGLEEYARKHKCLGILVSKDSGWMKFAATSQRLFHVSDLSALTEAYASHSESAVEIKKKFARALHDHDSIVRQLFDGQLAEHIERADWTADVYSLAGYRCTAKVNTIQLRPYIKFAKNIGLWYSGADASTCVITLVAFIEAEVNYTVSFYTRDPADLSEKLVSQYSETKPIARDVTASITSSRALLSANPEDWDLDFTFDPAAFHLELGEVMLRSGTFSP